MFMVGVGETLEEKMTSMTAEADQKKSKRVYVVDTNVLLHDADALEAFNEHDVILPLAVLEELDRQKTRQDDVGRNARHVSRALDKLRANASLFKGATLKGGGTLRVVAAPQELLAVLPMELREAGKVDNYLIALMLKLKADQAIEAIMVTKDINMRLKCDALDIRCEDHVCTRAANDPVMFYTGVEVHEDMSLQLIDAVYAAPVVLKDASTLGFNPSKQPLPNKVFVLKCVSGETKRSVMARCVAGALQRVPDRSAVFGLKPRNKEQLFALDLLMDPDVRLVTLVGPSGTGKTLLSLAAGLDQLHGMGSSAPMYDKLIVTRPIQPVGRDIGFMPGTLQEKMEPWVSPIRDNLEQLLGTKRGVVKRSSGRSADPDRLRSRAHADEPYLSLLMEHGKIEVEAITFIRGRSIPRSFIVIDEAQNLTLHELKTIITRAGEGTKIVLTGDIEQIDRADVDIYTNGLTYAVERFKTHAIAGHVTLTRGERSELATLASQIL